MLEKEILILPSNRADEEEVFRGVFFYVLDPPLVTQKGDKIIPTPLARLIEDIGEDDVTKYTNQPLRDALDVGDIGYEVVTSSRKGVKETPESKMRPETFLEMRARVFATYHNRRQRFRRVWEKQMRFAGRWFDAPPE